MLVRHLTTLHMLTVNNDLDVMQANVSLELRLSFLKHIAVVTGSRRLRCC
jgi:hypothetical protein